MKHTPHTKHTTFRTPFTAKDNAYRHIRWTGSANNLFACDIDNSRHDTLEAAVERRDYLESDAGKQEILQRNERRRIQREFDIAREERKARMGTERNEWRLEVCPFFEDGLEVFA
jgi:hypothetical protein